ncbi:MAG: dTMP kinase [Aeromicrobium erythreum]
MAARYTDSGVFVAFEGGEGGGKSTQSRLLEDWLAGAGHEVVLTREPGGTPLGECVRELVLSPESPLTSFRAEMLLYAADKAEHVDTLVLPALERGAVVVTDRYVDSTLAYQGAGRDLPLAELEPVARWATGDLRPHVTVVLDVDPVTGLGRAGDPDRIEREPAAFHARVRQHFLDLAGADPEHYVVVDGSGTREAVHAAVRAAVEPWLGQAVVR